MENLSKQTIKFPQLICRRRTDIFNYNLYLEKVKAGQKEINPFLDYLGITLVELKDGYARFRMPVRPEYLQGAKTMQGGLIVALADETIAHAMMTQLCPEEGLTTIELKSNFLAGVSERGTYCHSHCL